MKASAVLHLCFGRGDDTVGNPHRAQISQIELFEFKLFQFESFELILLLKQGGVAGEDGTPAEGAGAPKVEAVEGESAEDEAEKEAARIAAVEEAEERPWH